MSERPAISAGIAELVRRAAARFGTRIAVVDGERSLSFAEVERRSNALAHVLAGLAGRGARIAVLMPNQLETVECDFAIAKAGMVRVPINTRLSQDERLYLLSDSAAEVLVYAAGQEESAAALSAELSGLRSLVRVGTPGALGLDYDQALATAATSRPAVAVQPADPCYMLYTSGTTGRPKGAVSTHGGRLASVATTLAQEQTISAADVMVHMASTAHGSGSKVLPFFVRGGVNRLERSWDPDRLLDLAARGQATATFTVPTMVNALVNAAIERGTAPGETGLKTIVYGGAPFPPAKLRRALDVLGPVLVQVYGSAEAPHPVLLLDKEDHLAAIDDPEALSSAGRETLLTSVRLVDADGVPVTEPGAMGEIEVCGPTVMAGYWGRPEATDEVLHDGWYRTGDVARFDEQGRFYIVDRVRDLIISGGYNVYPAEVEGVIARLPEVRDVAVFGVPDETWGEAVTAVVSPQPGASLTTEMVTEHCREHLAGYKKPKVVEVRNELPLGATGKVLRRELRAHYWAGRERQV